MNIKDNPTTKKAFEFLDEWEKKQLGELPTVEPNEERDAATLAKRLAIIEEETNGTCYLVATCADREGCVALKTTHGEGLVGFKKRLVEDAGEDVQFVTISRPSAYGEYEPYRFVETEEEFEKAIIEANKQAYETLEAVKEVKRMKDDPALGKAYSDTDTMMKELLSDS